MSLDAVLAGRTQWPISLEDFRAHLASTGTEHHLQFIHSCASYARMHAEYTAYQNAQRYGVPAGPPTPPVDAYSPHSPRKGSNRSTAPVLPSGGSTVYGDDEEEEDVPLLSRGELLHEYLSLIRRHLLPPAPHIPFPPGLLTAFLSASLASIQSSSLDSFASPPPPTPTTPSALSSEHTLAPSPRAAESLLLAILDAARSGRAEPPGPSLLTPLIDDVRARHIAPAWARFLLTTSTSNISRRGASRFLWNVVVGFVVTVIVTLALTVVAPWTGRNVRWCTIIPLFVMWVGVFQWRFKFCLRNFSLGMREVCENDTIEGECGIVKEGCEMSMSVKGDGKEGRSWNNQVLRKVGDPVVVRNNYRMMVAVLSVGGVLASLSAWGITFIPARDY
ncbi:hypothetical protein HK101_002800 [Irineochytrium annulatum]|nr:hypothetical protein HK101_002800 [Irineochytrium annulatum]